MGKRAVKNKITTMGENNPPSFGKSLVEIFDITGKNTDFSKANKDSKGHRLFKDERGTFREMDEEKRKKDTKTIAE